MKGIKSPQPSVGRDFASLNNALRCVLKYRWLIEQQAFIKERKTDRWYTRHFTVSKSSRRDPPSEYQLSNRGASTYDQRE